MSTVAKTTERELTESELDMVAGGADMMKTQSMLSDYNFQVQYVSHLLPRQTPVDQSIIGNIRP